MQFALQAPCPFTLVADQLLLVARVYGLLNVVHSCCCSVAVVVTKASDRSSPWTI